MPPPAALAPADPHPGNIAIDPSDGALIFYDFGSECCGCAMRAALCALCVRVSGSSRAPLLPAAAQRTATSLRQHGVPKLSSAPLLVPSDGRDCAGHAGAPARPVLRCGGRAGSAVQWPLWSRRRLWLASRPPPCSPSPPRRYLALLRAAHRPSCRAPTHTRLTHPPAPTRAGITRKDTDVVVQQLVALGIIVPTSDLLSIRRSINFFVQVCSCWG